MAAARLPVATSDSGKLIGAGLVAIWRDGYRYKKAGVVLLDLHPAAKVQAGLFDEIANTLSRIAGLPNALPRMPHP